MEMYEFMNTTSPVVYLYETTPPEELYPIWKEFPMLYGVAESWLPITDKIQPGVRNGWYYVSTYGRFKLYTGEMLPQYVSNAGYLRVNLFHDDLNNTRQHSCHRLVMNAFCPIENSEEYQVNHHDEIKTHNWLWNLEWMTGSENRMYSIMTGHIVCGAKITQDTAEQIGFLLANTRMTREEIAKEVGHGTTPNIVHNIATGISRLDIYFKYDLAKKRRYKQPASEEELNALAFDLHNMLNKNNSIYQYSAPKKREICKGIIEKFGMDSTDIALIRYLERLIYKYQHNL